MHPDDDETMPGGIDVTSEPTPAESNLTDAMARFNRPAPTFDSAEEGEANGDADEESGEADEPAEAEAAGGDADAGEAASEAPEAAGDSEDEDAAGVEPEPVDVMLPIDKDERPLAEILGTPPFPEDDPDFDYDDWAVAEFNQGFNAALDAVLDLMDCGTDVILASKCAAIEKLRKA
jgi:hypothetical protein